MTDHDQGDTGSFRFEKESVAHFGKQMWRVSDDLGQIDAMSILSSGATACRGTDLERGLKKRAVEQHDIVTALSAGLDEFGKEVKQAVTAVMRTEDESANRITNAYKRL